MDNGNVRLGEEYSFLEDDPLHQLFDYCVSDTNQSVSALTVHICLYYINNHCKIINNKGEQISMPFLKYIVQRSETNYIFPQFTYQCIHNSEENDQKIRNEALTLIMNTFQFIIQIDDENTISEIQKAFKGFVLSSNKTELFMVYDYGVITKHFTKSHTQTPNIPLGVETYPNTPPILNRLQYKWAIVDELVFQKKIYHIPILPIISETFIQNPLLWNIKYSQTTDLDFPFSLYSVVTDENGSWINEKTPPSQEDFNMKKQSIVKIGEADDAYKYGDDYGNMYLFSPKPIYSTEANQIEYYQRYAVFTIGAKYVLDPTYHSSFIQHMEGQTGGDPEIGSQPILDTVGEVDTATQQEDKEIENMYVSSIYFVEDGLFEAQPIWGIRELSRFELL